MTFKLFEGPAGCGKTTRLFEAVAEHIAAHPLKPDQRVLALTKMHGSRRRMLGKLSEVLQGRRASECATLNSFVLSLVQRWRSLARTVADPLPADDDFTGLAAVAAQLLGRDTIVRWIAARHPLLVVDELQDLRGDELAVIRGLSRALHLLCAADDFQELAASQGGCEAVLWARSAGEIVVLDRVHRTNVPALLDGARSVRTGTAPAQGSGFKILTAQNANVAAGHLARTLTWSGGAHVAVLSPARPTSSAFVRDTLSRLAAGPIPKNPTNGKTFGPFTVPWEASSEDELAVWKHVLSLNADRNTVTAAEIMARAVDLPSPLVDWVRGRGRLTGQIEFPTLQIEQQLGRAQAILRAQASPRRLVRAGLTIHQAKNREFDRVIVLWPLQVPGNVELQRRLLYNGVTRAKYDCLVIVQDPTANDSRLNKPPFG